MLANTHKRYIVDLPYYHCILANLAVANLDLAVTNLDIEALGIAKMSNFSSSECPAFATY